MNDLLDEVQEFQKQEFVSKFLTKYGKVIIAACLLIVLCTAVWVYLENKKEERQKNFSLKFYNFYQTQNIKELEKISNENAEGFSDIAKINSAIIFSGKGDYIKSQKLLLDLYRNSKFESTSNYALFLYGLNALSNNNATDINNFSGYAKKIDKGAFHKLIIFVKAISEKNAPQRQKILEDLKSSKNNNPNFINLIDIIQN